MIVKIHRSIHSKEWPDIGCFSDVKCNVDTGSRVNTPPEISLNSLSLRQYTWISLVLKDCSEIYGKLQSIQLHNKHK